MKPIKYLLAVLSIIVVFLVGLWIFAPWESVLMYALDSSRLNAAENGIYINYGTLAVNGRLAPEFTVGNLSIETPLAKISVSRIKAKVSPLRSLMSFGAIFDIDFGSTDIDMVPKNKISIVSGHARFAVGGKTLRVSETDFRGDINVTGDATLNIENRKILSSTLLFEVPDDINSMLSNPMLGRYIESTEKGKWRMKYEAQNK